MTRALPAWAQNIVPVGMDEAAILLGISRRFLVDVIAKHQHYERRGVRKVFYPEHINRLRLIIAPPAPSTPLEAVQMFVAANVSGSALAEFEQFLASPFTGQVYVLRCNDRVKIGFTTHWARRFRVLKTSCPHPVCVISVFPGNRTFEQMLHIVLAEWRRHGEWFEEAGDVALLVSLLERASE